MPTSYNPYAPYPSTEPEPVPAAPTSPSGTSKEILSWVGKDVARAKLALATESNNEPVRKSLLADLRKIASEK